LVYDDKKSQASSFPLPLSSHNYSSQDLVGIIGEPSDFEWSREVDQPVVVKISGKSPTRV
jgi:hypothetical protein